MICLKSSEYTSVHMKSELFFSSDLKIVGQVSYVGVKSVTNNSQFQENSVRVSPLWAPVNS